MRYEEYDQNKIRKIGDKFENGEFVSIPDGLINVRTSYKIVEKEETKTLLWILGECDKIYDAYNVMSFPLQEDIIEQAKMIQMLNHQIGKKLKRLYRYYKKHFGITFDDADWGTDNLEFASGYRMQKSTENNIAHICETVKSWEN